jgi:hypothetical protein
MQGLIIKEGFPTMGAYVAVVIAIILVVFILAYGTRQDHTKKTKVIYGTVVWALVSVFLGLIWL